MWSVKSLCSEPLESFIDTACPIMCGKLQDDSIGGSGMGPEGFVELSTVRSVASVMELISEAKDPARLTDTMQLEINERESCALPVADLIRSKDTIPTEAVKEEIRVVISSHVAPRTIGSFRHLRIWVRLPITIAS
jgi:hypothetical protein